MVYILSTQEWTLFKRDWRHAILGGCNLILNSFVFDPASSQSLAVQLLHRANQSANASGTEAIQVNIALAALHLRMLLDASLIFHVHQSHLI
jgi:hypothetical protein